jgi:predicted O-linked N-acetylglucosamine transferase (SPINDLY family)
MNVQTLCNQAAQYHQAGRLGEAERLYLQILQMDTQNFFACHMFGILRAQQGRNAEALELIAAALRINPSATEALSNYGNILTNMGRLQEAVEAFDKALQTGAQFAETHTNRANILWTLRRPGEALQGYQAALRIKPTLLEALIGIANVLRHLRRFDEALASCDRALALRPDFVEALNNRGAILSELKRYQEALACYDKALAIRPNSASVLCNRGATLRAIGQSGQALTDLDRALSLEPGNPEALSNRGITLSHLKRFDEALACYAQALAVAPHLVEALNNRGLTLREMGCAEEALASLDQALLVSPNHCPTLNSRGEVLSDLYRFDEALACHQRVLALDPDFPGAVAGAAHAALNLCDWPKAAAFGEQIRAGLGKPEQKVQPLLGLFYDWGPELQAQCVRTYARTYANDITAPPAAERSRSPRRDGKIHLAYMSSDFRDHPIASVVTELFERHDRSRFEITAISIGGDDGSKIRARIVRAVDRFEELGAVGDLDAAKFLRDLDIDILVDLNGHTLGGRLGILSQRPAPVQVQYMGYPGTMGTDFMDYILADATVLPLEQQAFFDEKIAHLPDSYWACDTKRTIGACPSRREVSLPQDGFVFCCFNNNRKITPVIFDAWMRLLLAVPGSVLWLKASHDAAMANLRNAASVRGVDPSRLVFAADAPAEVHLARHGLADLFLDTLPYNAHATAADALWAGLPVITCLGRTFPGRVAASQLRAAGLPELVAESMEDYEALALRLARDPALLASYRARLAQARKTAPLFDTDRFRRNIEAAYIQMHEIARRGDAPSSLRVASGGRPAPVDCGAST